MSDSLSKVLTFVRIILMALSLVLMVVFYMALGKVTADSDDFAGIMRELGPILEVTMLWTYGLFIVAAIAALLFPLVSTLSDIKKLKGAIIPIVATIVIIAIARVLSSDAIVEFSQYLDFYTKAFDLKTSEGFEPLARALSKNVDTGLITTYILFFGAFLAIIYSEIAKSFK